MESYEQCGQGRSYCSLCTLDTIQTFFATRLIINIINKVQWVNFKLENVLVSLHSLKSMGVGSIIFQEWTVTRTFSYTERAYSTLLKYVENTEYTENLTESEKRKLRKQAKHYVSKYNLLCYVSAKGETRRVVTETEKHRILRACHSDSTASKYAFSVF
jgi:hypothetical protein